MIPVFLGIVIILFLIIELSPGDASTNFIDPRMRPEQRAEIAARFGLDQPAHTRFLIWFGNLLQGDFGMSMRYQRPVIEVIRPMIPPTIMLGSLSFLFSILVGIPAGIISATKQYTLADNSLTVFSLIGISMPSFFFGLLLLWGFAIELQWFPLFGLRDPLYRPANFFASAIHTLHHLFLPMIVLGMGGTATFMRYTRSSMLEVIKSDFIRTARAKGLKEKVVIYRHAMRNAMIPIITMFGFWIPSLLGGAVITESIFALPGLGRTAIQAIQFRDFPILLAINSMLALLTLVSALIADLLYAAADPRIKYD
jgi:peptide/nickel transport system permease protein